MRGASHVIVRCVFRALCGASLWGPAAQVGDRELLKLRNGLAAVILDRVTGAPVACPRTALDANGRIDPAVVDAYHAKYIAALEQLLRGMERIMPGFPRRPAAA